MPSDPFAVFADSQVGHIANPTKQAPVMDTDSSNSLFLRDDFDESFASIAAWPGYQPTSLRVLDGLARELDVASIRYKDEGSRFGLGSFKALGGA